METFAESSKRKQNLEKIYETTSKRNRTSGSETFLYLREKSQRELEFKEKELEVKKTKQAQFQ